MLGSRSWAMMGGGDRGGQEWLALDGRGKRRLGFCAGGVVGVAVRRKMPRGREVGGCVAEELTRTVEREGD